MKILKTAVSLFFLAWTGQEACAVGLGGITIQSGLGAALRAEVQLLADAADQRLGENCFRLSKAGAAESGLPVLARARLTLERQGERSKLVIVSDQFVNEPVLEINLRVGCGAEIVRSYTVLIDPVAPSPEVRAPAARTVSLPTAALVPSAAAPVSGKGPIVNGAGDFPKQWQVSEGESGRSIAQALFPRQRSAQRRFLAALRAENPQVDLGAKGEYPLPAGASITIPDVKRSAAPVSEPVSEVRSGADTTSVPGGKLSSRLSRPEKSKPRSATGPSVARLVISGVEGLDATSDDISLRLATVLNTRVSDRTSEQSRSVLRLEYKLLNELYSQASQQLEMAERIRNLEASLEEMRLATEKAAQKPDAATAAVPPATPSPVPVVASPAPQSSPATGAAYEWAFWAVLLLAVLGAAAWVIFQRFGRRPEPTSIPHVPVDAFPATMFVENKPAPEEPWAEEERLAIQRMQTDGVTPDLLLDEHDGLGHRSLAHAESNVEHKHIELHDIDDCNTAMELAEIMICFDHVQESIQTLREFLSRHPATSIAPWMKLLDVYHRAGMKVEFDTCQDEIREIFNVVPMAWADVGDFFRRPIAAIAEAGLSVNDVLQRLPAAAAMPRLAELLRATWYAEGGADQIERLLHTKSLGPETSFSFAVARELQNAIDVMKGRQHLTLVE